MEAIILAGGLGTRLKSLVDDLPKAMAPINDKPFLEILLKSLASKGFSRVILSLGFMAEKIVEHFGKSFDGMELIYEIEREVLGTGGAIRQALGRAQNEFVFVFNGDTFLDLEVLKVKTHWLSHLRPIIVACKVRDTFRYGRLNLADQKVTSIAEKGVSGPGLINAGCYVLPRQLFKFFTSSPNFSFENDFLKDAIANGEFDLFITAGHFIDIGIPEDYQRAQRELIHLSGASK